MTSHLSPEAISQLRVLSGIVTLIKNGPNLLAVREAKPLKLNIATTGEQP